MRPFLRERLTKNRRSGRGPAPVGAALIALTCPPGGASLSCGYGRQAGPPAVVDWRSPGVCDTPYLTPQKRRRQTGATIWGQARRNHGFLGTLGHCWPLSVGTAQAQKSSHGRSRAIGEEVGALCGERLGPGGGVRLVSTGATGVAGPTGGSRWRDRNGHRQRLTAAEPPALGAERAWRSAWSPPCDAHEWKSKLP
ncbi:hypothetical protein NDU88_003370 [Pleurodeles waltl]|uniref:Uncharacterized protein n=1 Tax=Pleurodeles waltl TaxID=8319 RepID=A0AAV7LIE8_PLEWA|nr:hypothetical protein NDU88_003370 [Pleurodeles waltl]